MRSALRSSGISMDGGSNSRTQACAASVVPISAHPDFRGEEDHAERADAIVRIMEMPRAQFERVKAAIYGR